MITPPETPTRRIERYALAAACIGVLMVDIDSTAMIVALARVKADLGFSEVTLGWVLNGFLVTYAGFRLLSGRLGDLYGHRSLLRFGLTLFVLASLVCAFAASGRILVIARAFQGVAGSVVVTGALSVIVDIFRETGARAKALAIYSFASAGGGVAGLLVGGAVTSLLGWRWIFLINVPVGIVIHRFCATLPADERPWKTSGPIDLAGAVTVTATLLVAILAIVSSNERGTLTLKTVALGLVSLVLVIFFLRIEARAEVPIVPLSLFRTHNLAACCVTNALFSAAGSAAIFASLYLQLVRGYDPFWAGLVYLPLSLTMALFSLGPSAKVVILFGVRWPLVIGLLVAGSGLALLCGTQTEGNVLASVLPGLSLLGLGAGIVLSPLLMGATHNLPRNQSGLVSGVIGTSSSMGRALGLALLTSAAAARTNNLLTLGVSPRVALNSGYHLAFFLGAVVATGAAVLALTLLKTARALPSVA